MVIPPPERPVFRHLEIHRVDEGTDRGLVLIDPLGLTPDQTFVPEGLLPIVGRFDGERTSTDILTELEQQSQQTLPPDLVTNLVADFDERLLLLSPRFEAAMEEEVRAFQAQGARPARHAGSAGYPADAAALGEALDSIVRRPEKTMRAAPQALVAPHIDLARGREGYAQAYGYLAECEPADLYVVFGTGHQGPSTPVTGLPLDWETPIGAVTTDRDFVEAVHARLGPALPHDLFLHRAEHSVEFQMLFLRHVLGNRDFRVAGFLCGGIQDPSDASETLQALRETSDAFDGRVCFVAGADLAHIGPFFGDADAVGAERRDTLAAAERARLNHLERADPGAFHQSVESNGNPDRVCGTTPMYLAASLAGGAGELLLYDQACAGDGSQLVSFCSMAFE